jgi:1-acyl-sn-glycerol-3-phosphate acyltransferase
MAVDKSTGIAIRLRSWAYLCLYLGWTVIAAVSFLPLLLTERTAVFAMSVYTRGVMVLARWVVGIDCRIEGREHLPRGPCIIACQHQTGFENYRLMFELGGPAIALKRELVLIPFVGWYIWRGRHISVDRGRGMLAMRNLLRGAVDALAAGRRVVIFPQGTRTAPGVIVPYRPGVAALYEHCDAPVIPAALNSDYCWGKTRLLKRPGTVTIRYLPALPAGLSRREMLSLLQERIEEASRSLPHPAASPASGAARGDIVLPSAT